MKELPPDAKAWLELADAHDHAPDGAADRVRKRLTLALGAAAVAEVGARALDDGRNAGGTAASVIPTVKLAVIAACVSSLGALGWWWSASPEPLPAASAKRQAAPLVQPAQNPEPAEPVPLSAAAPEQPPPRVTAEQARIKPQKVDLRAEVELLSAASAALERDDVRLARTLLRRHRTQFAAGTLREERRGLELLAQCLEGGERARPQAEAFLRQAPHSFLSTRIRAACHMESKP